VLQVNLLFAIGLLFFASAGQKRIFENIKGKVLQHIGTFLFHILCMENIYGMFTKCLLVLVIVMLM